MKNNQKLQAQHYFIGGFAVTLLCAFVLTLGYNGLFCDHFRFLKEDYGLHQTIYKIALAIVILALIGIIFTCGYILLYNSMSKVASVVLFVFVSLCVIGVIIAQIIGMSKTRYGDTVVPSIYNYYNDEEFKTYIDENYRTVLADGTYDGFALTYDINTTSTRVWEWTKETFPEFFVNFYIKDANDKYTLRSVPSCKFNWEEESIKNALTSVQYSEICYRSFESVPENAYKCVGGWDIEKFLNYWCFVEKRLIKYDEKEDLLDQQKAKASDSLIDNGYLSFSIFFVINLFFIILEAFAYICLIVGMIWLAVASREEKKDEKKEEPKKDIEESSESELPSIDEKKPAKKESSSEEESTTESSSSDKKKKPAPKKKPAKKETSSEEESTTESSSSDKKKKPAPKKKPAKKESSSEEESTTESSSSDKKKESSSEEESTTESSSSDKKKKPAPKKDTKKKPAKKETSSEESTESTTESSSSDKKKPAPKKDTKKKPAPKKDTKKKPAKKESSEEPSSNYTYEYVDDYQYDEEEYYSSQYESSSSSSK